MLWLWGKEGDNAQQKPANITITSAWSGHSGQGQTLLASVEESGGMKGKENLPVESQDLAWTLLLSKLLSEPKCS